MTILPRNSSQEQRRELAKTHYPQYPVKCTMCAETDPEKFYYNVAGYRASMCRQCRATCNRKLHYKKHPETKPRQNRNGLMAGENSKQGYLYKYGLTRQDYQSLLASQNGVCKICSCSPPPNKLLAVDHNHLTGEIRGLLCANCNSGMGLLKDNPELLRKAAQYLER